MNIETELETKARFLRYKLRTCRWLHECALCSANITNGQKYRDGGYGRRAHEACVARLPRANVTADGRELYDGMLVAPTGIVGVTPTKENSS